MINGIGSSTTALLGGVAGGSTGGVTRLVGAPRDQSSSALTTSAAIVADGAPIEGDRIASLRAAIRAGSYRADPATIATRMIVADLGGGQ